MNVVKFVIKWGFCEFKKKLSIEFVLLVKCPVQDKQYYNQITGKMRHTTVVVFRKSRPQMQ